MKQGSGKQVKAKVKVKGRIGRVPAWARGSIVAAYRRMAMSVTMPPLSEMKKSTALTSA